ncbi:kinesin-like protein KIN-14I [Corylus avellana]|uniref:kinesin-like protein KIN-14I n=1 Tax=Corylus avellana TaxID=13451 RepID=UPI00286AC0C9|nr:kinesin-like protein KIN-14I [Corylus avellana]
MVGVVEAKDLPVEPSEQEFRLGLKSGIILCNVLNKVYFGAVPMVVESPCDSALLLDGAALSAFQYFENVRNFLVAMQEMGIPTFEASDLEQKMKYSDKLGPQWSKEELEHFYEAYRKYGKDWKKVADVVHNGSIEMVEALYITNWVGSVHYC